MSEPNERIRLGAAQVAETLLDKDATVEKACEYIGRAGEIGIDVLVFPEYHIPGGPHWYYMGEDVDVNDSESSSGLGFEQYYAALFENAITVPGPAVERLQEAAAAAGTVVVMGAIEKAPQTTGTLYNAQVYIDGDGTLLGVRRKLVPTMTGRVFLTGGDGRDVRTFESSVGTIGGLMCGEHTNPLAVYSMIALGERIHAASWPALPWRGETGEWCGIRSRYVAFAGKIPVVSATGIVTDELAQSIGRPEWAGKAGASSIISPKGEYLAGPKTDGTEGIVHADVDLAETTVRKGTHDIVGHYNRFDIFSVTVDRSASSRLTIAGEEDTDADVHYPNQVTFEDG